MEPEDLAVIGHTGDLLVDIYARNLTHIYILPQCSTTAARVLNPAGMDAQFERLRCAISRGILNLRSTPDWAEAQEEVIQRMEKCTIRHELVHAFLNESGLQWNSFAPDKARAKNEEMVDWFAIQFPKMYEAFRLAGGI